MITLSEISLSSLIESVSIIAGLLIYLLVTRIAKHRRRPSVAFAWVLSIIAFPYVGIPLFLLFGTRKFTRPAHRPAQLANSFLDPGAPSWATQLLEVMNIAPPTRNTAVRLHKNGDESWRALTGLIGAAQKELDVCVFILGGDETGRQITDQLVARAENGVTVRLLIDAFGSMNTPREQIRRLEAAGAQVRRFMPILHNPTRGRANLRNHRKLVLADRLHLWSGGRNFADEYFFSRPDRPAWVDLSFMIDGPVAMQARGQFERDWRFASGRGETPATPAFDDLASAGDILAQWIPSGPDHADDTIYNLLLTAAYQAQTRILAVTPYFVPNETLLEAWCMAARRGVEITLVVPQSSNHVLPDLARGRALRTMAEAGANVLLHPGMVHAKMVVIDKVLGLCGSVNLDGRSLFLNYEAMTAFYGPVEIEWLAQWHQTLSQESATYRAHEPSWLRDIAEGAVRVIGFEL